MFCSSLFIILFSILVPLEFFRALEVIRNFLKLKELCQNLIILEVPVDLYYIRNL